MRKIIAPAAVIIVFIAVLLVLNIQTIGLSEVCALPVMRRSLWWMAVTGTEMGALFLVATLLLAALAPDTLRALADRIAASLGQRQRGVLVFLVVAVTLACGATAWGVLDGFANSADEYAFRFQGWTLAAGRLWNDPPAMLQAESALYVWAVPGKWVGQYPPGWPAFLALGDLLRLPEFVLNALFHRPLHLAHHRHRSARGQGGDGTPGRCLLRAVSLCRVQRRLPFRPSSRRRHGPRLRTGGTALA